jgi:Protein of unknown function (DUF2442)
MTSMMNNAATAKAIHFDDDNLHVDLNDGRSLSVPLIWFPRLLNATPQALAQYRISRKGLHWEALNEDISIAGLLAGQRDATRGALLAA